MMVIALIGSTFPITIYTFFSTFSPSHICEFVYPPSIIYLFIIYYYLSIHSCVHSQGTSEYWCECDPSWRWNGSQVNICINLSLWFIHPATHPSIHSSIHSSTHSFVYSFIYSFIHPFIHLPIHSSIHSSTHSFVYSFIYPFIRLFIHLLIHHLCMYYIMSGEDVDITEIPNDETLLIQR